MLHARFPDLCEEHALANVRELRCAFYCKKLLYGTRTWYDGSGGTIYVTCYQCSMSASLAVLLRWPTRHVRLNKTTYTR